MLQNRGRFLPQRCHHRGLPPVLSLTPAASTFTHVSPTQPCSLRATGRVTSHALLPPVPAPRVVCEIILCFTHALKCPLRKARMHLSYSVLSEAPGSCWFSHLASVGSSSKVSAAAFMPRFLLLGIPVSAAVKCPKYIKVLVLFGFAVLCCSAQPGMDVKLRVEFPRVSRGSKANPLHKQKRREKRGGRDRLVSVTVFRHVWCP